MAEPEEGVKRVLQIKLRALGDAGQILAFIRSAAPFYRTLGGTGFRVLQNVDEPAQLVIEIEYAANAELELNRGYERLHGRDRIAALARSGVPPIVRAVSRI